VNIHEIHGNGGKRVKIGAYGDTITEVYPVCFNGRRKEAGSLPEVKGLNETERGMTQ